MASIEKRVGPDGKVRQVVCYRDPNGRQRNKTFTRKIDAERYLTTVEHSKITGNYVDRAAASSRSESGPRRGSIPSST
jgi:hypothetical protein